MTIRERIAREYIRRWLPDFHLSYNPGKSPEYRKAVDKPMNDMRDKYALHGFEDYERRKEDGITETCR